MTNHISIDLETFSSVDITKAGAYRYTASPDFEILLLAYAIGEGPTRLVDLALGEGYPEDFLEALADPAVEKRAYNAQFERLCLRAVGLDVPVEQWACTQVAAAYFGLPFGLGNVAKALGLPADKQKDANGRALIRFFSIPRKPTKTNPTLRNYPEDDPEKWAMFGDYCRQDVEVEREIRRRLPAEGLPADIRLEYNLDQAINDRGVLVDTDFAQAAIDLDALNVEKIKAEMVRLTDMDNPNSAAQLKAWLSEALDEEIEKIGKGEVAELLAENGVGAVSEVLKLRQKLAKTSVKKYAAMLASAGTDARARGLFQFYGANRTGRWAGRLVQMQNLPRNYLKDLDQVREVVKGRDFGTAELLFDDLGDVLAQLVRTSFVAPPGKTLAVVDFSAIEARVIAWLAGEKWRLEVFETHGKIYEASASAMFGVPIDQVDKGLRQKGKIAELALGYQGGPGALLAMGADKMGLSEPEMKHIVSAWRDANPAIVDLWAEVEDAALRAVSMKASDVPGPKGISFYATTEHLRVRLPSGRRLYYREPRLVPGRFGGRSLRYMGTNQLTKQWGPVDTYGGKLVENIVQAIARDLLADSMARIESTTRRIVIHVHDEIVAEVPDTAFGQAEQHLAQMLAIMAEPPDWADCLPLKGDGYTTTHYKKD